MRKTLLLLAVALATFAENAWADKSFKTLPELTYGVAISPSGQYLVGVNPSYMVDGSILSAICMTPTQVRHSGLPSLTKTTSASQENLRP